MATIGSSGIEVSRLCLGANVFGWTADRDTSFAVLDAFVDGGGTLIDTAASYADGQAEAMLGGMLGDVVARSEVVISTKAGLTTADGRRSVDTSRNGMLSGLDASLARLRTDHIDLYQVHEWDGQTSLDETLRALDDLVRSGKVRYIGASNYTGWQLMKALWTSDKHGLERFVSQQIYYSLQSRDAESELVPVSIDQGLGILVWSPLAGGLLSGKYRRGQDAPEGTRRFQGWSEPPVENEDQLYDTIDLLVEIGEGHGVSAAQVALAWTLTKPAVTSLVIGARTEEQLADNLAAATLSGVKVKSVTFWIFVNMGVLAAVAGVIFAGRLNQAGPTAGLSFELDAIAAAFIGGAAVTGGVGKVVGAIAGGLIMAVMSNGMQLMGVDQSVQSVVKGLVLLLAVAFDIYNKRRAGN